MTASRTPRGVERSRLNIRIPCALSSNSKSSSSSSEPFILYWTRTSLRSTFSPSLAHAISLSNSTGVPLRAIHVFSSVHRDGSKLPIRHAKFLLEALADLRTGLCKRGIPLLVLYAKNIPETVHKLSENALAIVTDTDYLRMGRDEEDALEEMLRKNDRNTGFTVVEGNVVVPVEIASEKLEHAARTIRPKITRAKEEFLMPLAEPELKEELQWQDTGVVAWPSVIAKAALTEGEDDAPLFQDVNVEEGVDVALKKLDGLDMDVPVVHTFIGGEKEAQKRLAKFLKERLRCYGKSRNEPTMELQSDLSPYLRLGCISPVDVTLQTLRFQRSASSNATLRESVDSFLEELIVRRELSVNMLWHDRDGYDIYERGVPQFAQITLEEHRGDKRSFLYGYDQLEAGATHDGYWNAAQKELVLTGKMHGYMRMYWAKQIIGWTKDAKTGLQWTLRLNNRWGLDAVDGNSYAGVIWCYGRHDHGWTERPVWGKVRYMNEAGLKRKFNMLGYVDKITRLTREVGMPAFMKDVINKTPKGYAALQSKIASSSKSSVKRKQEVNKKSTRTSAKRART